MTDPIEALTKVAQACVDRMNHGDDVTAHEAYTLGQITSLALAVPGVQDGLVLPEGDT